MGFRVDKKNAEIKHGIGEVTVSDVGSEARDTAVDAMQVTHPEAHTLGVGLTSAHQTQMLTALSLDLATTSAQATTRASRLGPLFASDEPLSMTIEADFSMLVSTMHQFDAPATRMSVTVEVNGKQETFTGTVRSRGESSRDDLHFPKLKLNLKKTKGTLFAGNGSVAVGVRGGDGGTSDMGRILTDAAPMREAAAYAVLSTLGLPVPAARVVNIRYVDSATGRVRSEKAFLLQDSAKVAKEQLGRVVEKAPSDEHSITISTAAALRHELVQTLLDNRDYMVPEPSEPDVASTTFTSGVRLHNTVLIKRPDRSQLMPRDFDVSVWVLQESEHAQHWSRGTLEDCLDRTRRAYAEPVFQSVVASLLSRRELCMSRLRAVPLDDEGRAYLIARTERFFTLLEQVARSPRPLDELEASATP